MTDRPTLLDREFRAWLKTAWSEELTPLQLCQLKVVFYSGALAHSLVVQQAARPDGRPIEERIAVTQATLEAMQIEMAGYFESVATGAATATTTDSQAA